MKKRDVIYRVSLLLNVVLIMVILLTAYKLRTKIYDKINLFTYDIVMIGPLRTQLGNWDKNLPGFDIKNSGAWGYSTGHYLAALKDKVIKYNPKICFIGGGIVDIILGVPLDRTITNYQDIINSLRKQQIEPVLQSTLYVNLPDDSKTNDQNSKVDSLNTALSALANEMGITYLDLNPYLSENGRLKKELSYGIYPNEQGYKIYGREVGEILKQKGF